MKITFGPQAQAALTRATPAPFGSAAVRAAMERQDAEVRLAYLAGQTSDGTLLGRALAEVTRRRLVLDGRLNALRSVYDDLAAGRMR